MLGLFVHICSWGHHTCYFIVAAAGLEQPGKRRHRKVLPDAAQGISKGDVRRLSRRGGVKRSAGGVQDEIRAALKSYLEPVLQGVAAVTDGTKPARKTAKPADVVEAVKANGKKFSFLFERTSFPKLIRLFN